MGGGGRWGKKGKMQKAKGRKAERQTEKGGKGRTAERREGEKKVRELFKQIVSCIHSVLSNHLSISEENIRISYF